MTPLLTITDLRLTLPIDGAQRPILRGVDLQLGPGEALGVVGESGSGKSMMIRSIIRLLPDGAQLTGSIEFDGTDLGSLPPGKLGEVRSRDIAMIFQNPRAHINPVRSIGDFLVEGLRHLGRSPDRARKEAVELLEHVQINDPPRVMRSYPHQLSGGMLQRVMIAAALAVRPKLLLADEPTTALDATTQAEVMRIVQDLRREHQLAMIFVTHDLELADATCDRTAVMYAGAVVEEQPADRLLATAGHPYTRALLAARPSLEGDAHRLAAIPGQPLPPYRAGEGYCAFVHRCPWAIDVCRNVRPPLAPHAEGHTACHRADEVLRTGSPTPEVVR